MILLVTVVDKTTVYLAVKTVKLGWANRLSNIISS